MVKNFSSVKGWKNLMAISIFKALAFGFFPVGILQVSQEKLKNENQPSALTSVRPQACGRSLYPTQMNARIANCRTGTDWLGLYWIRREDLTMFPWCDWSTGIHAHSLLNKVLQESVGLSVVDIPKIFLFSVHVCAFIQFDMGFYRIWSTLTFMR
jgi:hypothetical protein